MKGAGIGCCLSRQVPRTAPPLFSCNLTRRILAVPPVKRQAFTGPAPPAARIGGTNGSARRRQAGSARGPIVLGRNLELLLERPAEMRRVAETPLEGDGGDRFAAQPWVAEVGGAAAEALAENVAADAVALLLEQPVQLAHRDAQAAGACPDSGAAPAGIAFDQTLRVPAQTVAIEPGQRSSNSSPACCSAGPSRAISASCNAPSSATAHGCSSPAHTCCTSRLSRRPLAQFGEFAEGPLAGWQVPAYLFAGDGTRCVR